MTNTIEYIKSKENENKFKSLKDRVIKLQNEYDLLIKSDQISNQQKEEARIIFSKIIELHRDLEDNQFNVGVIGTFNAGKSTFLNALLGGKKILSTKKIPETASITEIKYLNKKHPEIKPYAMIHFFNQEEWDRHCAIASQMELDHPDMIGTIEKCKEMLGSKMIDYIKKNTVTQPCTLDQIDLYTTSTKVGNLSPLVKKVEVYVDAEICANQITLIDTPGLNDPNKLRELITEEYLENIDLLIMIFPAQQAFTDHDKKFITKQLSKGNIHKIFFVMNKIDEIKSDDDDDDIANTVQTIKNWLKDQIEKTFKTALLNYPDQIKNIPENIEVFELSAYQAYLNKLSESERKNEPSCTLEESRFPLFEDRLKKFLLEGEKYETLLENTSNRINLILNDRLEDLNQFIYDLDGNIEKLQEDITYFKQETSRINDEIKNTKLIIDRKIDLFTLVDRNLNIKRLIENIKTIIRLYAQRELDDYLKKSNTGKKAVEGFEDWCRNKLSPRIKNILENEFSFLLDKINKDLSNDYQILMKDIYNAYVTLDQKSKMTIGEFKIKLTTESSIGILETAAVGASFLLGPIAIIVASLYTLYRIFSSESAQDRSKYEDLIKKALQNQVLTQFDQSIDKISLSLQDETQKNIAQMLTKIKSVIYLPIKYLEEERTLKEKQLYEKMKLLKEGDQEREIKKSQLYLEINMIKGK